MDPRLLLVAIRLLTRLPVGRALPGDEAVEGASTASRADLGRSVAWFPMVGMFVGGVSAFAWWATALVMPRPAAAVLAVAAAVLLTGGRHEVGIAMVVDGMVSGHDPPSRLSQMDPGRIGAHAALALMLLVLLRVLVLASLDPVQGATALVVAAAVSLGAAATPLLGSAPAGPVTPWSVVIDHVRWVHAGVAGTVTAVVAVALLGAAGVAVLLAGIVVTVVLRTASVHVLGGISGAVIGAIVVLVDLTVIVIVVALNVTFVL